MVFLHILHSQVLRQIRKMFKAVAIFEHHAIRKFVYQSMRILHRGF